jgi:hypothetical protein
MFVIFKTSKADFVSTRRVGNGEDTFSWTDPWLGGVPLRVKFRRLFDLFNNKSGSVTDMCELGWEEGGAAWQWRRQLWTWEGRDVRGV